MKQLIEQAELGHSRRNERLFALVAETIAGRGDQGARPPHPAPWPHAMASYRFYANDALPLSALYQVHRRALRACLRDADRAYLLHDLSTLDYSGHDAKADRIRVGDHRGLGYELYTALVLDEAGRPLGPLVQQIRTANGLYSSEPLPPRRRARGTLPNAPDIEQMEQGVEAARRHLPGLEWVHVADREFDDVALQRSIQDPRERYVIRAQHLSRRVSLGTERLSLREAVERAKLRRGAVVERQGVRYRRWVGETTVTFDGLSWRGRHRGNNPTRGEPIAVRVVVVELRARGAEAVRWVLLTNVGDAAEQVAQIYVWRWKVERFFFLAKVGMRLEDWTQQDGERIARRLAVASLAAMVLHQLLTLRDRGEGDGAEAVEWVARWGGWLGRKAQPPGPRVLMRGVMQVIGSLTMIETEGVEKIRAMAEQIFPGIAEHYRKQARARDV